jgi:hypothetical protein
MLFDVAMLCSRTTYIEKPGWKELIMRYVAFSTNNLVSFNFIRCIEYEGASSVLWGLHRTFPICNCCWVELAIRCRATR